VPDRNRAATPRRYDLFNLEFNNFFTVDSNLCGVVPPHIGLAGKPRTDNLLLNVDYFGDPEGTERTFI